MNVLRAVFWIGCLCASALLLAVSQAASSSAFPEEFFRPVLVSPLGVSQDRLAGLTNEEISDLTTARRVLGEFFRRLEKSSGNPLELLTPEYAHEKPSRLAIRTALIADESSVMEIGLTDFRVLKADSLELRFYALIMTEGSPDAH